MRRPLLLLGFCILLAVGLAGCAGDTNIRNAPYENVPLEDVEGNDLSGASAERLYQAGHQHLVVGNPKKALRIFLELQARFPFSRQATQAALEAVTAHYLLEEYAKTVSAADRFIKQHPRHPHIDYLYYLRGLANYHRNDTGLLGGNSDQRDLSYLRQAFSDFKLLLRNFPDSVYARDARLHMIEIRNRLADFELTVAEYYLKRHAYVAAARRAAYIVKRYQRSTATPRALEIMQEAYIQLGLPALAADARAILQASYSGYIVHRGEFYRERANDYYGDDALPSQDIETRLVRHRGPIESLWYSLFPNQEPAGAEDEDDDAWRAWLQGRPAKNLHPNRYFLEQEDDEGGDDTPAAQEDRTPAAAADGDDTGRGWMEGAPAKNLRRDEVPTIDDGGGAAASAEQQAATQTDDTGFFGDVWNILTPGEDDPPVANDAAAHETTEAPDASNGASQRWLEGVPAKK